MHIATKYSAFIRTSVVLIQSNVCARPRQSAKTQDIEVIVTMTSRKTAITIFGGKRVPENFKYTVIVPRHFGAESSHMGDTVQDLLEAINTIAPSSLFRGEIEGIVNTNKELIRFEDINNGLPEGGYTVRFITSVMSDQGLADMVDNAVHKLKQARSTKAPEVLNLEIHLLTTKFTHTSLTQDGSTITLREVNLLAEALEKTNVFHSFSDSELMALVLQTNSSEREVVQAVNHIQVAKRVHELIYQLNEITILDMHKQLMDRLLVGFTGEYRKVEVAVTDSKVARAHSNEVQSKMQALFETLRGGQRDEEHITQYLTRIHTAFQLILPFRAGNGRVGRLIMNMLAIQQGYPIVFFREQQRYLFNAACERAHEGNPGLFERMLLESMYATLRDYEQVIPNLL